MWTDAGFKEAHPDRVYESSLFKELWNVPRTSKIILKEIFNAQHGASPIPKRLLLHSVVDEGAASLDVGVLDVAAAFTLEVGGERGVDDAVATLAGSFHQERHQHLQT